jgi:homoserine kinase
MKSIKVFAPGTVANMVCGFDILGFALNEPSDIIEVTLSDEPGIRLQHLDNYNLPTDPAKNICGVVAAAMMAEAKDIVGVDMKITKHIMPGSGIGSSAASSAGVVVAINHLLDNRFSHSDLIRFAMEGEKLATGVKHADNIAPCIYGGVTLIRSIFPLDIIALNTPLLHATVVHPQIEVKTSDARQILKKQLLLKDAIKQWGNIAGLVAGLEKNDYDLIGRSLEDIIVEPVRSILIPGFDLVKQQSKEAGALGGGISGSGPSIFMLSKTKETANSVAEVMKNIYEAIGIDYNVYVTTINKEGCKIIE